MWGSQLEGRLGELVGGRVGGEAKKVGLYSGARETLKGSDRGLILSCCRWWDEAGTHGVTHSSWCLAGSRPLPPCPPTHMPQQQGE